MPDNWDTYKWGSTIVPKYETDGNCPFAKDRSKGHKEICDCFKPQDIEGWVENIGETMED